MENYKNENQGSEFADPQSTLPETQPETQDVGATNPTDLSSGDVPTGTDDTSAPQDPSGDVGIPKDYQGGEQGEYTGDQQQQTASGYGAGDDVPAQDNASAPGYGDKSQVGDTDATGTFDQPTTDQTQFGSDAGANNTNGYDAGSEPPTSAPGDDTTAPPPAPKKESFMTKLKDKLPGHHKATDDETATADEDQTTEPPKQGLMTKIKEKIHI